MPGIGFNLEQLIPVKKDVRRAPDVFVAKAATFPLLLCFFCLGLLAILSALPHVSALQMQIFANGMIYTLLFPQILVATFLFVLARYVSDRAYHHRLKEIHYSIYTIFPLILGIGSFICFNFFIELPLDNLFKTLSYIEFILFTLLIIQTIYMVSLNALKKLSLALLFGLALTLVTAIPLVLLLPNEQSITLALAFDFGLGITTGICAISLNKALHVKNSTPPQREWDFFKYMGEFPSLMITGLLFASGLFIPHLALWNAGGIQSAAQPLDTPLFFAYTIMIPALLYFSLTIESKFRSHYVNYFILLTSRGNLELINKSRLTLVSYMRYKLRLMLVWQLLITILALVICFLLKTPMILWGFAILGANCAVLLIIIMQFLLCCDDRFGALCVALTYMAGATILCLVANISSARGVIFLISALLGLILAFFRMNYFTKRLDYFTFCSSRGSPFLSGIKKKKTK